MLSCSHPSLYAAQLGRSFAGKDMGLLVGTKLTSSQQRRPMVAWLLVVLLGQGVGPDVLQRSLPTSTILRPSWTFSLKT